MNEKAFEKVERDLNLATGEIKIMGAKDRHFAPEYRAELSLPVLSVAGS